MPDKAVEQWPVVYLSGNLAGVHKLPGEPHPAEEILTEACVYCPASHPAVLSPGEARRLVEFANWAVDNHIGLTAEQRLLVDRLATYAEQKESSDAD